MREEEEGESNKGGLGLGEGEGVKDVSDQIESEDQLEDARKPGDYGQDEEKDCKASIFHTTKSFLFLFHIS